MFVGGREFGAGSGMGDGVGMEKPVGWGLEEAAGAGAGFVGTRSSQSSSQPRGWPMGLDGGAIDDLGADDLAAVTLGAIFVAGFGPGDDMVAPKAGCDVCVFAANLAVVLFFQSSCFDVGATEVRGSETSNSPRSASMFSGCAVAGTDFGCGGEAGFGTGTGAGVAIGADAGC